MDEIFYIIQPINSKEAIFKASFNGTIEEALNYRDEKFSTAEIWLPEEMNNNTEFKIIF